MERAGVVYWISSDGGRTFFGAAASAISLIKEKVESNGGEYKEWSEKIGDHECKFFEYKLKE